jgi:AraC-like DNA-binding protein
LRSLDGEHGFIAEFCSVSRRDANAMLRQRSGSLRACELLRQSRRRLVLYLTHSPPPPLAAFVDHFWLLAGAQIPRQERILPGGTMELVVNLRENEMRIYDAVNPERYRRFSGAVLSGTYSRAFVCDALQHESIVGVHFRPGGAVPFLDGAANELADTHADLADVFGQSASELHERLCEVATPQDRFQILEEFLMRRLHRRASKHHPAVAAALNMFGVAGTGVSVRDVARSVGLCERRFIQVFSTHVGVTPKLFCRLLRFQRARAVAQQVPTVDWSRLASSCGYFDQSHLIRDFQEFSSSSPTEYLRQIRKGDWLKDSHVALLE